MDRSNLPSTMLQQVQRPACCRGTPSAAMPQTSALRRSRGTCALRRRVLPGPSKRERASARLSVLQASLSCMSIAYHGCYVRLECGQCVCKVQIVVQARRSPVAPLSKTSSIHPRYLKLLRTEQRKDTQGPHGHATGQDQDAKRRLPSDPARLHLLAPKLRHLKARRLNIRDVLST